MLGKLSGSRSKTRSTIITGALLGTLLLTSACGGDEVTTRQPAVSPSPISTEADITSTNPNESSYGPEINGMTTEKELASDSNGQWRKITLKDNDTDLFITDSLLQVSIPATKNFGGSEHIAKAYELAARLAIEVIDTGLNGDPYNESIANEWFEKNKDKFHPDTHAKLKADLLNNDPTLTFGDYPENVAVFKGTHRDGYNLEYGEDKTHIASYELSRGTVDSFTFNPVDPVTSEFKEDIPVLQVKFDMTFENAIVKDGVSSTEERFGFYPTYTFGLDEATGELLIVDYKNKFAKLNAE